MLVMVEYRRLFSGSVSYFLVSTIVVGLSWLLLVVVEYCPFMLFCCCLFLVVVDLCWLFCWLSLFVVCLWRLPVYVDFLLIIVGSCRSK